MSDNFSLRFSLFPSKEKKSDKSPDASGSLEIQASEVKELVQFLESATPEQDYQGNAVIKLRMAGWKKEMKDGRSYQSGLISAPQPQNTTPDF